MDFILQPILLFIQIYIWIIIISALLSLLQVDPRQPLVEIINRLTEPAFSFVRQKMPYTVIGGLDLSPLVLIIGLQLLSSILSGNIFVALIGIISSLVYSYIILIIISTILTFVNVDPFNPIVQVINRLTNPPLMFVRQKLPFLVVGGIDLSPLVVIFGLQALVGLLRQMTMAF
jgi:YggT family protein